VDTKALPPREIAGACRITSLDSQTIGFGALMARRLREKIAISRFDPVSGRHDHTGTAERCKMLSRWAIAIMPLFALVSRERER
jgi:hypothetical protein